MTWRSASTSAGQADGVEARGFWNESLGQRLLELDPDLFASDVRRSSRHSMAGWPTLDREGQAPDPARHGRGRDAHVRHPVDREHIRNALPHSEQQREELVDWRCSSSRARSASMRATPGCRSSWRSSRRPVSCRSSAALRAPERDQGRFRASTAATGIASGTTSSSWSQILRGIHGVVHPGFPWKSGPLKPEVKELIYTAFDVRGDAHVRARGCAGGLANALGYGATPRRSWRSSSSSAGSVSRPAAFGIQMLEAAAVSQQR